MYNDSPMEIIFDIIADLIIEYAHERKENTEGKTKYVAG